MADNNDTLFREVEEELRREQIAKAWKKYGTFIVMAVLALPLGVLGYQWNQQRQRTAAETTGSRFEAATSLIAEGKVDDATKAFAEMASDAQPGYAALAQLRAASALAGSGKKAEAVAAYDAVASGSTDSLLRDFARLQAAALRIGDADFTEVQNRLNDLTTDNGPWRFSARELIGIAALRAGKVEEARKAFETLVADPAVPASLGERARLYMSRVVAVEQAAGNAKPAAAAK